MSAVDQDAPELLPCPFCGSVEMLRRIGADEGQGYGFVRCDYCDAEGPDPDVFPGGWNQRAEPDLTALQAENERLRGERDAWEADATDPAEVKIWHDAWTAMDDEKGYAWNKMRAALRALAGERG